MYNETITIFVLKRQKSVKKKVVSFKIIQQEKDKNCNDLEKKY